MTNALMIDFGSTYTKLVAIHIEDATIIGRGQAPTTVDDLMVGLNEALAILYQGCGKLEFDHKLACSSAGGGLRMVAVGFVKELTAEAAKRSSLGAGAKVIDVFSYGLDQNDLIKIKKIAPDMILLSGGTDGGNSAVILENAQLIAQSGLKVPVVIAGNKKVAQMVAQILSDAQIEVIVTENVLPQVDVINVEPARKAIREVFMKEIIKAKGLDKAQSFVGSVLMPTPMAVLKAAELIADGTKEESGLGEIIIVDVGGATTDLHSVSNPVSSINTSIKGLVEPRAKRTVEGDLGIRHNALTILEMVGEDKIAQYARLTRDQVNIAEHLHKITEMPRMVPTNTDEELIDLGLARSATEIAISRHAGTFEEVHFVDGKVRQQTGKDFTFTKILIGTGGVFTHGKHGFEILKGALFDANIPNSLRPKEPQMFIDSQYCLFAIGLLAEINPSVALKVAKKALKTNV